jgi:hypothetical protein
VLDSGAATLTSNAVHSYEASCDGTNCRLFIDGVLKTTVAAVGTTFQRVDEAPVFGSWGMIFPDDSVTGERWVGQLDSFRLSKVARHTSGFTPPTAKFASDSNTLLLLNFDKFAAASNYVIGVDAINGRTDLPEYAPVRGGTGPTQGAAFHLRDMSSSGGAGMAVIMAEPTSFVQNLSINGFQKAGIEFYGNSYSTRADHIFLNAGCGLFGIEDNAIAGGTVTDFQENGGYYAMNDPELVNKMIWTPSASGIAGLVYKEATVTTGMTCIDCILDVENGGAAVPVKITGSGSVQFTGGDFQTNPASNVEAMDITPGFGLQVLLLGTHYEGGSPAELIHFITQQQNPQVTWIDPHINGNAWSTNTIPLTDWAGHAQVIGDVSQLLSVSANIPIEPCSNVGTVTTNTSLSFAAVSCQKITTATTGLTYTLSTTGVATDQVVTIESYITGAITGPLWATSSGAIKWAGGSAPTSSGTSGYVDVLKLKWDGTNWQEISRSIGNH